MQHVLVTDVCHKSLIEAFTRKGFSVSLLPTISYEELLACIPSVDGLVVTTRLKIDAPLLSKATRLKWIGRLGSGMELIDVPFAEQHNITCISTPEGNAQAVAEHVMGMLLSMMNNIHRSVIEVQNHQWHRDKNRGDEIAGKTFGIIGYGHTGQALARIVHGFQPERILVYDKYKKNCQHHHIVETDYESVVHNSDIISLHLPLTAETHYFADDRFFNAVQKTPYFINASRGKIVHTQHLIEALQQRRIKAALLDVLENEKLTTYTPAEKQTLDTLCQMPNVLITPHIAGYSFQALEKMAQFLIRKLEHLHLI